REGGARARRGERAGRGQVLVLDGSQAGTLGGIRRLAYDGTELPIAETELVHAEITTRDIDRGSAPHFLLKEISEAPGSFRKTLRGKLVERRGELAVALGSDTVPDDVLPDLAPGSIDRIVAIGHAPTHDAAQSLAAPPPR